MRILKLEKCWPTGPLVHLIFSSKEVEAQERKSFTPGDRKVGGCDREAPQPPCPAEAHPYSFLCPSPPRTPPPSYETLFSIPLPRDGWRVGQLCDPLEQQTARDTKHPCKRKELEDARLPECSQGVHGVWRRMWGPRLVPSPMPEACLPNPHVDFPCGNLRSL